MWSAEFLSGRPDILIEAVASICMTKYWTNQLKRKRKDLVYTLDEKVR